MKWRLAAAVVFLLAVCGTAAWFFLRVAPSPQAEILSGDTPTSLAPSETVADPRLSAHAPANAKPGVAVAGDAACAVCHAEIATRYRGHAMAQSMGRPGVLPSVEKMDAASRNPFDAVGLIHEVRAKDGKIEHAVSAPPGSAGGICEIESVSWVLGSGKRGRSYLVGEGRLYQSPLSWFSGKGIWDLSPGFHAERQFTRAIVGSCLFCHANQPEQVPGTLNSFRMDGLQGIGCERCHGAGSEHVARWQDHSPSSTSDKGKPDNTIVNPARLPAEARDSICQQCHLQGIQRTDRRGRHQDEFRPGLNLADFWSVAFLSAGDDSRQKVVGQVEQMESSKCYQASAGRLSCFSCHDPHGEPSADKKGVFYRQKCMTCHEPAKGGRDCTEVQATRATKGDRCAECHMPKVGNTDIVHASITDHRTLRKPDSMQPSKGPSLRGPDGLFLFRNGQGIPQADRDRATGLAMVRLGRTMPAPGKKQFLERGQPLVEAAFQAHSDDIPVGMELVALWRSQGKTEESLSLARALKLREPEDETVLAELVQSAIAAGRHELAIDEAKKLWSANPKANDWGMLLAEAQSAAGQWDEALATATRITQLHPFLARPRMMAIEALTRLRRDTEARAAFDVLLAMRVPEREGLIGWFHAMKRGR